MRLELDRGRKLGDDWSELLPQLADYAVEVREVALEVLQLVVVGDLLGNLWREEESFGCVPLPLLYHEGRGNPVETRINLDAVEELRVELEVLAGREVGRVKAAYPVL